MYLCYHHLVKETIKINIEWLQSNIPLNTIKFMSTLLSTDVRQTEEQIRWIFEDNWRIIFYSAT